VGNKKGKKSKKGKEGGSFAFFALFAFFVSHSIFDRRPDFKNMSRHQLGDGTPPHPFDPSFPRFFETNSILRTPTLRLTI
jgi:hypothetical protein